MLMSWCYSWSAVSQVRSEVTPTGTMRGGENGDLDGHNDINDTQRHNDTNGERQQRWIFLAFSRTQKLLTKRVSDMLDCTFFVYLHRFITIAVSQHTACKKV
jgi:hypothetical protein